VTTAKAARHFECLTEREREQLCTALAEQENFGNFAADTALQYRRAELFCREGVAEHDIRDSSRFRLTDYGVELAALALAAGEQGEA
jgi:uncharacterized membrane protein